LGDRQIGQLIGKVCDYSAADSIGELSGVGKGMCCLGHDTMGGGQGRIEEKTMAEYTEEHARAGVKTKLPELDTWPNQFPGYVITTRFPEYSSICPKTGLPDFGTITIRYMPKKDCIELKALKMYLLAYRDLGIFYENAVNKILHDIVEAVRPEWCIVRGEFTPRGGLSTSVFARWPRLAGEATATRARTAVGQRAGKRNKR
jgi:7-cyano-7-deazaguanine reductase